MGMTGGSDGYNDMARMAMSHPAFLDQAERPQVHFGSAAQFQVSTTVRHENLSQNPIFLEIKK